MGKTPSFEAYYGKNDLGLKVKLGISFGNQKYPGINHPSEVAVKTKQVIKQSTKATVKKFSFDKKKRN